MASLEALHEILNAAASKLNEAANAIREAPLDPVKPNIHHIANALSELFELQRKVWVQRPELIPEHLWEAPAGGNPSPQQIIEGAFRRAERAETAGDVALSVAVLEHLIRCQPSGQHIVRAKSEVARMNGHDT
jgi:hypothetical protein